MALFTLFRVVNEAQVYVFISEIRVERQAQYHCRLQCSSPEASPLKLVREMAESLQGMGFEPEFDHCMLESTESCLFCVYRTPSEAGNPADAIRTVCSRHGVPARIATRADGRVVFEPETKPEGASESRAKTSC